MKDSQDRILKRLVICKTDLRNEIGISTISKEDCGPGIHDASQAMGCMVRPIVDQAYVVSTKSVYKVEFARYHSLFLG